MSMMRKCQSLGCIRNKEKLFSEGDFTEDEVDQQYPFNYLYKERLETINDSPDEDTSSEMYDHRNLGINFRSKQLEDDSSEPFDMNPDHVYCSPLFSTVNLQQLDNEVHDDIDELSTDLLADSGCLSSDIPLGFARSQSDVNLRFDADNFRECTVACKIARLRSGHFEPSRSLNEGMVPRKSDEDRKSTPSQEDSVEENNLSDTSGQLTEGQEIIENNWGERFVHDNENIGDSGTSNYIVSSNEERVPPIDDAHVRNLQQDFPIETCEELNPKEFSTRRLEEWIGQIDIGDGSIVEEPGESSGSFPSLEPQVGGSSPLTKLDARSNLGTEVAYNYLSSLNAASSAAHMANLGLAVVPILSGFNSLRMLNLSGNFIVRITGRSLPRGLHMLNLSKNNIATIEGFRDLTRLRVLDLSYNRIVKIGHGLASCSSLKELYLSCNKISEVDGLHRLLKLNILDLRNNKISTAKGLAQLASNYSSLQSINLDGNPAQRNVGDEQLRKYLLSLLPNLVYYNKHTIKASGGKEISERPRSSVAHQYDHGSRTEHNKLVRKGSSRDLNLRKSALSHVRSSPSLASLVKQSNVHNVENLHTRFPLSRSKPETHMKTKKDDKQEGTLRANGELDRWEAMVGKGLGGSMAAVLSHPK